MTPAHRVIINTGILYARMAITVLLSLYTTRLTLNVLGSEDFGIFNVVGGTIAMLTFLNASMAAATQRFMSFAHGQSNEERQQQIFNVSLILHALIALLILGMLEGAGLLLFNGIFRIEPERMQAARMVYQFATASIFFTIIAVPYDAVINARENMLFFAVLGVIEALLKLAIAVTIVDAAYDKLQLYGLLMATLPIPLLIMRAIYCHWCYQECKWALWRQFNRPLFKEMTSFASWSLLGSTANMIANYGQGLVLNAFFGAKLNAAQGIANQVSGQLGVFAGLFLRALNPLIAKSEGAGNRELMLKASQTGSKVGFFMLMFFFVPIIVEMPYLFELWLKEVPPFAVIFCQLLLLRNLIEQLFVTLVSSISAVGNIKNYQIISTMLISFPLPLAIFIFQFGFPPFTLYLVFLGYAIVASGVILYFANQICALPIWRYLLNVVLRCFVSFGLVLGFSWLPVLFMEQGISRLLFVAGISMLSFFLTVWLIGFVKEERDFVRQLMRTIAARFLVSAEKLTQQV